MVILELDGIIASVESGVIKIWFSRAMKNTEEAGLITSKVDEAAEATGIQLLLFDVREAERTSPEVQVFLWNWLTGHDRIRQVATVQNSKELGRNLRRVGAKQAVRIKTFQDEDSARLWLAGADV